MPGVTADGSLVWDGRTAAGVPVPDGRYTVSFLPTDAAGNDGVAAPAVVDVYGALKALTRTPTLFYPQDEDTLGRKATASFTLLRPATVSISVLDASGAVVRAGMTAKALPAGLTTWAWNGKTDAGTWAPRGTYRIVVTATNGTQAAGQSVPVLADAFRFKASTPSAVRGKAITITATSAEPLSPTPKLVVRQPGLPAWTVTMTRTGTTTWTATITPKKTGAAGTLVLTVRATDTAGGDQPGLDAARPGVAAGGTSGCHPAVPCAGRTPVQGLRGGRQ